MWYGFATQLILAISMTAAFVHITAMFLHDAKETNKRFAHELPIWHKQLEAEQDPDKLRHKASAYLDAVVSGAESREAELNFSIEIFMLLGFGWSVCSLGYGFFAYRLQRRQQES
jgi:hypothetical protein